MADAVKETTNPLAVAHHATLTEIQHDQAMDRDAFSSWIGWVAAGVWIAVVTAILITAWEDRR